MVLRVDRVGGMRRGQGWSSGGRGGDRVGRVTLRCGWTEEMSLKGR